MNVDIWAEEPGSLFGGTSFADDTITLKLGCDDEIPESWLFSGNESH